MVGKARGRKGLGGISEDSEALDWENQEFQMGRVRDELVFQRMEVKRCVGKWVSEGQGRSLRETTDRSKALLVSFC